MGRTGITMQFEALVAENKKKAEEVRGMMEFITGEINDYKKDQELQVNAATTKRLIGHSFPSALVRDEIPF